MPTPATDTITVTPLNRTGALPVGFLPGQARLVQLKDIVRVRPIPGQDGARLLIRGAAVHVDVVESWASIAAALATGVDVLPGE